ncbi:MAG: putative endonuclease [Parcubacteria group bacterium Athens1014_10]|nr:MAG: putative endonuclease [Parcubacteria group bacterium Athens1014_10]TSD04679.1 MAG: putative endonuclease [Parcubacteria group bacterium Athens0714_12]
MHYVYWLKSTSNDKVYVGFTNDLKRRIKEHNSKNGGKYTKNKGPFTLIYYEGYRSENDAKRRENNLKLHKKAYTQLKTRILESLNLNKS